MFKKAAALLIGAIFAALAVGSPFIAIAMADTRTVVLLDAGHGGSDAGVTGARTGVRESDLNLKVVLLLGEYLEGSGYRVAYTRTADVMYGYPGVVGNKKRADMFRRGDIINRAKPAAVVSIHMNFYSSPSRRGAQTFYAKGSPQGQALAEALQQALNEGVNAQCGGRSYSALTAQKYILECSPYPTAIAECGFLSNPQDETNLCDEGYRAMLAGVLRDGIIAFLMANEKPVI